MEIGEDQSEDSKYILSNIWYRFWAIIIDSFILGAIIGTLSLYNIISIKSVLLVAIITITGILYKPLMEYKYGATLGKMAFKIKVVDYYHEPITFKQAFLRSSLQMTASLISMAALIIIILTGEAERIQNFTDYTIVLSKNKYAIISQYISYIILLDYLFIFSDNNKRCLHDRIASTLVVKPI
jgi:uncharacterized RDD family membrane protein YckC